MTLLERVGLSALRLIDPERAHGFALSLLRAGFGPAGGPVTSPALATTVAGLALPNPVGIAAGFDKNALALPALLAAGPGFVEVGAVTPRPQPGNPRPRLFRLAEDRAVINRFGFNNDGMVAIRPRLEAARGLGVVGVNLGANKDSDDRAGDFAAVLDHLYDVADFFTVNVSSPNTQGLRDLQGRAALEAVLARVMEARGRLPGPVRPVFVKVAPDIDATEVEDVAAATLAMEADGIIATNTTVARDGLKSPRASEPGGLSGSPLFARSTEVLGMLLSATDGRLPLIGCGGISSGEEAYTKFRAGAEAVQLYTALAYEGLSLVLDILRDLEALLERDGFGTVAQACCADREGRCPPDEAEWG